MAPPTSNTLSCGSLAYATAVSVVATTGDAGASSVAEAVGNPGGVGKLPPPAAAPIIAASAAGLIMAYGLGIIAGGHIKAGFGGAWLGVEPFAAAAAAAN